MYGIDSLISIIFWYDCFFIWKWVWQINQSLSIKEVPNDTMMGEIKHALRVFYLLFPFKIYVSSHVGFSHGRLGILNLSPTWRWALLMICYCSTCGHTYIYTCKNCLRHHLHFSFIIHHHHISTAVKHIFLESENCFFRIQSILYENILNGTTYTKSQSTFIIQYIWIKYIWIKWLASDTDT